MNLYEQLKAALKDTKFALESSIEVSVLGYYAFTLSLDEGDPLTYDMLDDLATRFKTDKINLSMHHVDDFDSFPSIREVHLEVQCKEIPVAPAATAPEPPPPPKRQFVIVAGGPILASAWARGRQCKQDEALFYTSDEDLDLFPKTTAKLVYVGPNSAKKDEIFAHLKELGYAPLEE